MFAGYVRERRVEIFERATQKIIGRRALTHFEISNFKSSVEKIAGAALSCRICEDPKYVPAVGDQVMQTRNNYEKGVLNGDVGTIVNLYPETGDLVINFNDQALTYDALEIEQLQPLSRYRLVFRFEISEEHTWPPSVNER